jgi:hypothetical protein
MKIISFLAMPVAAAALTACASLTAPGVSGSKPDDFEKLHAGLSQDEVRQFVGAPDTITDAGRRGERVWIYQRANAWDSQWEWDVTVGPDGKVRDVTSYSE